MYYLYRNYFILYIILISFYFINYDVAFANIQILFASIEFSSRICSSQILANRDIVLFFYHYLCRER